MRKNLFKIFALLIVFAMVVAPVSAQTIQDGPDFDSPDPRLPEQLPQEILDAFEGGMSIDEFLLKNQGPIPNALKAFADEPMVVIVQMEQPSLIEYMVGQGQDVKSMRALDQKTYVNSVKQAQTSVTAKVAELGGVVMGQYTKAYNGLLVKVTAQQLQTLREMDGVKNIYRAPEHTPALVNSIPLINADDVWGTELDPGYTGEGITIAVIDTGIDYTHAMFGGAGTEAAYANNDPNVIEPGSFPTMKVIGGYDFAGTDYDAGNALSVPVPDDDPLDEGGHGTHVASTAAGIDFDDTDLLGAGVAPDAKLYALKVFGADGSTNLTLSAIEWAMDPDGDGDVSDHVDVINMSLGSDFGPNDTTDPEIIAVNNAAAIGIFIAASAGNAGDSSYIVGAPSAADAAMSVAASGTGSGVCPSISYTDGSVQKIAYQPTELLFDADTTAKIADADALDGTDSDAIGELCVTTGLDTADFEGRIALVRRGDCTFETKIDNAETLGAVGIIIYNHAVGGESFVGMLVGDATLPTISILPSAAQQLIAANNTSGNMLEITVGAYDELEVVPAGNVDTIASFSSRGPRGFDSVLKPEITAPGLYTYAAEMGGGEAGVNMSGTSMAAPHIAGVAALMKQAHPTWSVEEIKAAMMNTAVDLDWAVVDEADAKISLIDVPRQGAGRVDALAAVNSEVVAIGDEDLVSINWGVLDIGADSFVDIKTITLKNFGADPITYSANFMFTNGSSTGVTLELVTPGNITVPAMGSVTVPIKLTLDMTQMPVLFGGLEEYFGFVVFSETTGLDEGVMDLASSLRIPFYFSPRPYGELAVTDAATSFDAFMGMAEIELTQTGSTASDLWAFPAVLVDPNESTQEDHADLRYVGLDYVGTNSTYGEIFAAAFAMYGPVHTNQPYFSEVDLYVDADQDGFPETVNFNFNYGWYLGGDDDNDWVVVQVDYTDGYLYLGSPYPILADFNSGVQRWYLPAAANYVTSTFGYEVYSFDWYGSVDYAGSGRFDISKPPLGWYIEDSLDDFNAEPEDEDVTFYAWVDDLAGYNYSQPKGIMLLDYNGRPGMGQSYYWPLEVTGIPTIYMPLLFK